MGWDFTYGATKNELIDSITGGRGVIASAVVIETDYPGCMGRKRSCDDIVWTVQEHNGEKFIMCHILDEESGMGYGSCEIAEIEGPSSISCPVHLLDLAPVEHKQWRAAVKRLHKKNTKRAVKGG